MAGSNESFRVTHFSPDCAKTSDGGLRRLSSTRERSTSEPHNKHTRQWVPNCAIFDPHMSTRYCRKAPPSCRKRSPFIRKELKEFRNGQHRIVHQDLIPNCTSVEKQWPSVLVLERSRWCFYVCFSLPGGLLGAVPRSKGSWIRVLDPSPTRS